MVLKGKERDEEKERAGGKVLCRYFNRRQSTEL